MTIMIAKPWLT